MSKFFHDIFSGYSEYPFLFTTIIIMLIILSILVALVFCKKTKRVYWIDRYFSSKK